MGWWRVKELPTGTDIHLLMTSLDFMARSKQFFYYDNEFLFKKTRWKTSFCTAKVDAINIKLIVTIQTPFLHKL